MKELHRPQSMLVSINNNSKYNNVAYQYIQADVDKMNLVVENIEQTANKLIPLVPPNLNNDLCSLKMESQKLISAYSSNNYDKYKNKLKMAKDSLKSLNQKVSLYVNSNTVFNPTKMNAESFYNDVKSRILNTTKQQCSNIDFCIESELKAFVNRSQIPKPLINDIPRFDTPSPKIVFYKKKSISDEKEKIILAIKDQTDRLSNIYSKIIELKSLQKNKKVANNEISLAYLQKKQDEDTQSLSELDLLLNVLHAKNNGALKTTKEKKSDEVDKVDVVMKEQLDSFENLSNSMIQTSKKRFEEAKKKVKENIQMIRARLEILENRINEYGDFNGETNDMMTYIGMKVDEVINYNENMQIESNVCKDPNSEDLANIYLDVRTRIAKNSIESQLESIKRSIRYYQFSKPLIV